MSIWRTRCRSRIDELTADLPADATLEQRRKALWGKGQPAHDGTTWGRKMWGREVRAYLARHGDAMASVTAKNFTWPDHIHFPFRSQPVVIGCDLGAPLGDICVEATIRDGRITDVKTINAMPGRSHG